MKAVIVEIKGTYAAVLSDDGCITRVANNNYAIGQVIEMKEKSAKNARRKIIAIATSATAVFALFSIGAWAYFTPYYYVSLDVNPSIEYSVNRFERVIGTTAVNDDGAAILENLNVQNESIDEAINDTINQIATEGYFPTTEEGGIVIATSCSNDGDADRLALKIQERAQDCLNEAGIKAQIQTVTVARERVLEAKELGVTPGKLNLVEKLRDSSADPNSIVIKDWLDKPVKDIMKAIKANDSINNNNKSDNANDSNSATPGSSNKSTNANASNSATPGSSNKSDNASDSNSTTPGSSNKSINSNDSNTPSPSNSGNKSDSSKSGFSSNGSKSNN